MEKLLLKPAIERYLVASLFLLLTMVLIERGYTTLPFFTGAITAGIAFNIVRDLI
jgi:hypothetical protein